MTKSKKTPDYEELSECRMCDGSKLIRVLNLGRTPLANSFLDSRAEAQKLPMFPLSINVCEECNHAQLSIAVNPELLFRHYLYEAGPNMGEHFQRMARDLIKEYQLEPRSPYTPGDLVVEFGSNDGSLLKEFEAAGIRCVGVEPSRNLAQLANERYQFATINDFFTPQVANRIRRNHGPARLVVANNVMAHIKDWKGTLLAVERVLTHQGDFVFEVQDRGALLRDCLFDMIYHEHLDYHDGREALRYQPSTFADAFIVEKREHIETHGGSLRISADRRRNFFPAKSDSTDFVNVPNNCLPWFVLSRRIATLSSQLIEVIDQQWKGSSTFVGYGAPAKFTTMAYALGLPRMDFVVDDSKLKQERFTPGRAEPIVPTERLIKTCAEGPVTCFVNAWNFADKIILKVQTQCREAKVTSPTFIVPLPEIRVVAAIPFTETP